MPNMFDFETDKDDPRFSPTGAAPKKIAQPAPVGQPAPIDQPIPIPPPIPHFNMPRPPSAPRRRSWAWVVLAVALVFVVSLGSVSLAIFAEANRPSEVATPQVTTTVLPTPVDARIHYDAPTSVPVTTELTLDDGSSIVLEPWDGASRLTILLMGIDRRTGETGLFYRTDTMMLISFDPVSNQLGLLSIPRDLWVDIPGYYQQQRINTALEVGESRKTGYGPALAMETVQNLLGMNVNNYVIMDFSAVITLVDAVGGIDIDVPYAISDYSFPDMHYGYDPLVVKAGLQHMDGSTALQYSRTRHADNDFARARRQQLVLFALRDRILSLDSLPQLIIQAPSLYASLSRDIYTGLSLDQIIQLGLWLKDLPVDNIHTGQIDLHYSSNITTIDGQEVLLPYMRAIPRLMEQVFGSDYNQ